MGVRRRAAAAASLLVLLPIAGCADEAAPTESAARVSATPPSGPDSPGTRSADRPSPSASPTGSSRPGEGRSAGAPAAPKHRKRLEGGGLATAVPGSDDPRRKRDPGPQYAVSDDLDIEEVERLVAAVEKIAGEQRVEQPQATGGSLAAAVGTFSYRWFDDGSVAPDPAWVAANIRTETVPILGSVTGHKVMFPQLRGAMREIVARGLADEINPGEYGGCYVPRFIGHDPQQGLSLHTWGIALDLNVPGNLRGTVGEIDRDVVAIFKKWGFAWGGDWRWTDPMHFELAALVR